MSGIYSAFQLSLNNLSNMREGISVVNENIANINTPGYSQKRIIFKTGPAIIKPYGVLGTGAFIDSVESIRNSFVEERLRLETEAEGFFKGQEMSVVQLETIFTDSEGSGIGAQLSRFFDAWLDLSSEPTSVSLREAVIAEGEQTAFWIQKTAKQIDNLDIGNQQQIVDVVRKVNSLLGELSEVNRKLSPLQILGTDGGSLFDERVRLVRELSGLIDIQTYNDGDGSQIVTTNSGNLLLAGSDVTYLSTESTISGQIVTYSGTDISSSFHSGELGGLLEFQNNVLGNFRGSLNDLARELSTSVNAIHANGATLNSSSENGGDFFSVTLGDEAKSIRALISDPNDIAARTIGTAEGDGSNALDLARLRDSGNLNLGDQTFTDFFSEMVFEVGLIARGLKNNLSLQSRIVNELESFRGSISGVSLDEEAVKLLQFQRSYQASSKMIKVLDELMVDILNLVG